MKRIILMFTIIICICSSCGKIEEAEQHSTDTGAVKNEISQKETDTFSNGIEAAYKEPEETVSQADTAQNEPGSNEAEALQPEYVRLHTEEQQKYLEGDSKLYKLYANGTDEKSIPEAVVLAAHGNPVELSTDDSFSAEGTVTLEATEDGNVYAYNLLIGKHYYYRIKDNGDASTSQEIMEFITEPTAPRNLNVPGLTNVRDIGGWTVSDGKTVKQGLLFRSSKLNADNTSDALITPEGITVLKDDLGIITELDLRTSDDNENGGLTESLLGPSVRYISIPIVSGGNIILLNKDSLKDIFAVLGDEENYPLLFHCSIGTDRTGMLAFLINGLMGVSEEDLYRDFLFSNFGSIGKLRTPTIIKTYIETVSNASGNSLSERIENYLIGCGVAPDNISTLRRILL